MSYRPISSIWKNDISELIESFESWWIKLEQLIPKKGCDIFFRADDIGYPGKQFSTMVDVFKKNKVPLALAVVPAWVNQDRIQMLFETLGPDMSLWCMHQHGYKHMNKEKSGKKFEFGPSRDRNKMTAELTKGKQKLDKLLGSSMCPIFTPPWNRCSTETMACLIELGFIAISRCINVSPYPLKGLPDLPINIDLHTIKEKDPKVGIKILMNQIEHAVQSDYAGFMLHHQRMNKTSVKFLDFLLAKIAETPSLRIQDIRDILPK
ncbi:polysaccharide deacetylase family protein [Maridesulfovibrio ferrireducens]|uniref:polysaccharide deacetylase family protein n=1 Tax=Maridesulfovibrio ferrireducens TaxID=246191 RepID=UPI001A1889BE|nr:polysaccharide deacetylase family protein [Maridesulfovibrio ferrireducens]MBI9110359.1 polysaccharide deacetylase family protein [Maridesulfovibrio ferrireducens]